MGRLLLFGAGGAIGSAIAAYAVQQGFEVVGTGRKAPDSSSSNPRRYTYIQYSGEADSAALAASGPYDAVCWAQGANAGDSVYNVDIDKHHELYDANCAYILASLRLLLERGLLTSPARMVVLSSIWQTIARQDKLSYTMSKAALQGFVHSAALDLGRDGHLINIVMPGVLDTPMTRANLKPEQLARVIDATFFGRLATPDDVASLVCYLCSKQNNSITGQSIAVDLGFSNAHML
ncbi:MAG TPA: SDR family oxidoreductase [Rickettsiales bacterium]|nr:SDR family oxidoreductase [Rickettsiales bacterium]